MPERETQRDTGNANRHNGIKGSLIRGEGRSACPPAPGAEKLQRAHKQTACTRPRATSRGFTKHTKGRRPTPTLHTMRPVCTGRAPAGKMKLPRAVRFRSARARVCVGGVCVRGPITKAINKPSQDQQPKKLATPRFFQHDLISPIISHIPFWNYFHRISALCAPLMNVNAKGLAG